MNRTDDQVVTHPQTIKIRPGLLDRLKDSAGIRSDDAFSRLIGISRTTLDRLNSGHEPNLRTVIGIAQTFGLAIGEVVSVSDTSDAEEAAVEVAS